MHSETTGDYATAHLEELFQKVVDDRDFIIVRRECGDDVAIIALDDLASLMETANLLRGPEDARRLLQALRRTNGQAPGPQSVDELREELGIARPAQAS